MRADPRTLQRLAGRTAEYKRVPDPPRGLRFAAGVLSWEKPRRETGVTHFRIYAPNENQLVRSVPIGQLRLQDNLTAPRVFVSSYNANGDLESSKIVLVADIKPVPNSTVVAAPNGMYTVPINASNVALVDRTKGLVQKIVLDRVVNVALPIGTPAAGDYMDLVFFQDSVGGWLPTFNTGYKLGYATVIQTDPLTYHIIPMFYNGASWGVRAMPYGGVLY